MSESYPRFAVVGHPNKGKSSIVAALTMNETVAISEMPGTTLEARAYRFELEGRVLYEMIDTPGFQRPKTILAWLKSHYDACGSKHRTLEAFIEAHRHDAAFHDDVALLVPIVERGAAIIYVVDISLPYRETYEAQMEILRWCEAPSMALLNHIDKRRDYGEAWTRVLRGYFQIIKRIDPYALTPKKHLALMDAIAHLNEGWEENVMEAKAQLAHFYRELIKRSAVLITEEMEQLGSYRQRFKIAETDKAAAVEEAMRRFKESIAEKERHAHAKIAAVWRHEKSSIEEESFAPELPALFSKESEVLFGLKKETIIGMGALGGAAVGAGIDALFLGHTLLLGGAIGGVLGAAGAYLGFERVAKISFLGIKAGEHLLELGPIRDINMLFVLLLRALYFTVSIAKRSHAERDALKLTLAQERLAEQWLDDVTRKEIEKLHRILRQEKGWEAQESKRYVEIVSVVLENNIPLS